MSLQQIPGMAGLKLLSKAVVTMSCNCHPKLQELKTSSICRIVWLVLFDS